MGASISSKFSDITSQFDIGLWKVWLATQKSNNKVVSIWMFDFEKLCELEPNKKLRRKYMAHIESRLRTQMKMSHPLILEIRDIAFSKKRLGFTSTPVRTYLDREKTVSRDEAIYIAGSLASVMKTIHDDFHMAFGNLTPQNVFFTQDFRLKLGLFLDSVAFQSPTAPLEFPFVRWSPENMLYHAPRCVVAPEIADTGSFFAKSDVYMYALCVIEAFTNVTPEGNDNQWAIRAMDKVPEEYRKMLRSCLASAPEARPTFASVLEDEAFSSMVCGVFQYLEVIHKKNSKDLMDFFTGLKKIIDVFSVRLLRYRFLRLSLKYLMKEPRYGVVIIPMMFAMHPRFDNSQFVELVLNPIMPIIKRLEVPKGLEAYLDNIHILLEKVPLEKRNEYVYTPILLALTTNNPPLLEQALKVIPYVLTLLEKNMIQEKLVPALINLLKRVKTPTVAASTITTLIICSNASDADAIANVTCPAIQEVWISKHWKEILAPATDFLLKIGCSASVQLGPCMSLAVALLRERNTDQVIAARLVVYIRTVMNQVRRWYQITEQMIFDASQYSPDGYDIPTTPYVPDGDDSDEYEEEEEEEEGPLKQIDSLSLSEEDAGTRQISEQNDISKNMFKTVMEDGGDEGFTQWTRQADQGQYQFSLPDEDATKNPFARGQFPEIPVTVVPTPPPQVPQMQAQPTVPGQQFSWFRHRSSSVNSDYNSGSRQYPRMMSDGQRSFSESLERHHDGGIQTTREEHFPIQQAVEPMRRLSCDSEQQVAELRHYGTPVRRPIPKPAKMPRNCHTQQFNSGRSFAQQRRGSATIEETNLIFAMQKQQKPS